MPDNYITLAGADEKGSVNISEDVIAVICAEAIAEVDGVAGQATSVGAELQELFGKKNLSKGVKVSFEDGEIVLDTLILVRYGEGISAVATRVQESVISAIESMTGMKPRVNVHVSGVAFEK